LNNKTGVKGVMRCENEGVWRAYIGVNGRSKSLGRFDNIEMAIEARREAEEKYFGEYAYRGVE